MVNIIRNNTISKISAKKSLNTLNEIANAEIIKYKKCTFRQKELLNLFNDLLDIILTDKTLESENQENENENEKVESRKEENENENAKNRKAIINTKKDENGNKDEDKNVLLEYIKDVDDKLFKKYGHGKDFNSFINEFDHAKNKKYNEKIVKEIKEINDIVYHYINMDENSEYTFKLIDIANAIDYFLYQYSKKWASDFNWREAVKDY